MFCGSLHAVCPDAKGAGARSVKGKIGPEKGVKFRRMLRQQARYRQRRRHLQSPSMKPARSAACNLLDQRELLRQAAIQGVTFENRLARPLAKRIERGSGCERVDDPPCYFL